MKEGGGGGGGIYKYSHVAFNIQHCVLLYV